MHDGSTLEALRRLGIGKIWLSTSADWDAWIHIYHEGLIGSSYRSESTDSRLVEIWIEVCVIVGYLLASLCVPL